MSLLMEENSPEAAVVNAIEQRVDCGGCGVVELPRVAQIAGLENTEVTRIINDLARDGRLIILSEIGHTMYVTLTRSWS